MQRKKEPQFTCLAPPPLPTTFPLRARRGVRGDRQDRRRRRRRRRNTRRQGRRQRKARAVGKNRRQTDNGKRRKFQHHSRRRNLPGARNVRGSERWSGSLPSICGDDTIDATVGDPIERGSRISIAQPHLEDEFRQAVSATCNTGSRLTFMRFLAPGPVTTVALFARGATSQQPGARRQAR